MNKTDELIERALSAEDRELLARHGGLGGREPGYGEPGYFRQAFGLFRGSLGWVVWLAYLTGIAAFAGFIWALWQLWTTAEPLVAVRWGVVAVVLFQYTAMIKTFLGAHMEANRALRELKRIELQVALLRGEDGSS